MPIRPQIPANSAVASYIDGGGNSIIHVFVSDGYTVTDKVWTGAVWQSGSFSQAGRNVSATAYVVNGTPCIRVYCVSQDVLTEYGQDGGGSWYVGGFSYP